MSVYAVLIGINDYAGRVPDLRGCHNDVNRVASILNMRFQVPDDNILFLKSEQATKANIVDGFKTHLAQAGENDSVLVYFSGHGAQEPAPQELQPLESDGYNETLVCHDSRVGAGDLADKEIRYLISRLAKNNPHILVIFDCCHSGGGTREVSDMILDSATRRTSSAGGRRSISDYIFYEEAKREGWLENINEFPLGRHMFLSGCRDDQLAKEKIVDNVRHGVFSHYLCKALETHSGSFSYQNLVDTINQQVQASVNRQNPQLDAVEGSDPNQLFLSTETQPPKYVVSRKDNRWWLDAGQVQGISAGDQVELLAAVDSDETIATAIVASVEPARSLLEIEQGGLDEDNAYYSNIILKSIPKQSVLVKGEEEGVRALLEHADDQPSLALYPEKNKDDVSYSITAREGNFYIRQPTFEFPLYEPVSGGYNEANVRKVLGQVEHLHRWSHRLELNNPTTSIPADAVELVLRYEGQEYIDEDIFLEYHLNQETWGKPGFSIEIRLNDNWQSPTPLFCSLFFFNSVTGEIASIIDEGTGVWLRGEDYYERDGGAEVLKAARRSYKVFGGEEAQADIPELLLAKGIFQGNDFIKLVVSEKEFNTARIIQPGLKLADVEGGSRSASGYRGDDRGLSFTESTRGLSRKSARRLPDWMSKTVSVTTSHPHTPRKISAHQTQALAPGVEIEPHGLQASMTIETEPSGLRVASSNALPDSLQESETVSVFNLDRMNRDAVNAESALVLYLPETRSVGESGQIDAEHPLVINIDQPLQDNEHILGFTSDGEFIYPVARAESAGDKTRILVEQLPDVEDVDGEEAAARGLTNSLKLYFRKVVFDNLGLGKDAFRLAIPQFDEADPSQVIGFDDDESHIRSSLQGASKVAVFIHGIIGETRSMAGALNFQLEDGSCLRDDYDAWLCFDYENLNTPIQEIASRFKQALHQAGIAADDGKEVHLIAHSMGGLVSRWMIEQEQGKDYIDKLIMLGTPNNGSPWAGVKSNGIEMSKVWAYGGILYALNSLATAGIATVAIGGLMKLVSNIDNTLDQMAEDSDFIKSLYAAPDPGIPYYLIAGVTDRLELEDSGEQWKERFQRLMQKSRLGTYELLSKTLFEKENDIAVNTASMRHIPAARVYELEARVVASDHLSYFVTADSVEALARAIRE